MKSILKPFLVLFLVVAATATLYAGSGNRLGTGGATELLIPTGARDLAMGGSTIATTSGLEALFWNPAGITKSSSATSVSFSHMSYIADIGVEYGAVSAAFEGLGTIALDIKSLSIGDIPVTTVDAPDGTGQTFTPQFFTAGLTFARQLSDRIGVGLTANLVTERMGEVSASGIVFNVGVMYDNLVELKGLSLGVAIKNVGPQMRYDGPGLYRLAAVSDQSRGNNYVKIQSAAFELPSTLEFGLGYKPTIGESNALLLSTTFQNNNFSGDEYKLGAEYGYNNMFFVRGGYSMSPKSQSDDYIYGFTAGVGINYQMEGASVTVNYAYRAVKYFDGNHLFSVSFGL
jgi:hypothetical protein